MHLHQILHSTDVQQAWTFPREGFTITAEFMGFSEMKQDALAYVPG